MRILLIEGTGQGFLSHYSHALALGFHNRDCAVRLVTRHDCELSGTDLPVDRKACLDAGARAWRQLRHQVREFRPNCVHLQWVGHPLAAILFVKFCQKRGIRVLYTPHNLLPHRNRWLFQPLYRWLYQTVDGIVARDLHIAWGMQEILDIPLERGCLIEGSPNLLSYPEMPRTAIPELHKQKSNETRLLLFGYGGQKKGVAELFKTLSCLPSLQGLHLILAGKGLQHSIPSEIFASVAKRARVTVINRYLPATEASWLFEHVDLLVLPYQAHCNSPLVDLSLSFATPVLRSDLVSHSGFTDGLDGFTYAASEPEALADILHGVVQGKAGLKNLGENLRFLCREQLLLNSLVDSHLNLYNRIHKPIRPGTVGTAVLEP